ncbi:MAG: DUF354 domain-containing protein [Candidatus Thorarchaeota archaeon]
MRILFDILHPAHAHFFRHIYDRMKSRHDIQFVIRNKDVTRNLMDSFGLPYSQASDAASSSLNLMTELIQRSLYIDKIVRKSKIDILAGISGISLAFSSFLRSRPLFVFTDTEDTGLQSRLVFPIANRIVTPNCFARDFGKKHIRYKGYQELAYLHPNYFKPDASVLHEVGLSEDQDYVFLRFTSFGASHDISQHGLNLEEKTKLVDYLSSKYNVMISSEGEIPKRFEKFRYKGAPRNIHHFLHYARLFFGDSQTMTTEAGILGTPAIRCNSLAGSIHGIGNFTELERTYGLVYSFRNFGKAFQKMNELLAMENLKDIWNVRRSKMLSNMDDVVEFVSNFIESYHTEN